MQRPPAGQLHGETQSIVVTALAVDDLTIGIVQMKIPRQIHWRGLGHIATIVGTLLSSKKFDRHGRSCRLTIIAQTFVYARVMDE